MKNKLIVFAFVTMLLVAVLTGLSDAIPAMAQTNLSDEEQLERDFTDPLSTLPQLILRDSFTPANYGPCTQASL